MDWTESLIEHDLFGKPLHTFPDHARIDADQLLPSALMLIAWDGRRR
jgi:hypothetical protein